MPKPTLSELTLATGESDDLLVVDAAERIQNLLPSQEGGLQSVRGPALFEPGSTALGRIKGMAYANLQNGSASTLIIRAGSKLFLHHGWEREFVEIASGLSDTLHQSYPDQFVTINNVVVWTNGVDAAQVILHDGVVLPLGFDKAPSAPSPDGPEQPDEFQVINYYSNSQGYSWPGPIGTPGDVLSQHQGKLLAGSWVYYDQFKDQFGNLSPKSMMSASVDISEIATAPMSFYFDHGADNALFDRTAYGATIDQLTRQFFVRLEGDGPDHATGHVVSRTKDLKRNDNTAYILGESGGLSSIAIPDNWSDAALGKATINPVGVPIFRVMCVHGGALVIGNLRGEPGKIRKSQVNLFGTFDQSDWVLISQVDEVTALCSHFGMLIAFTERGMFDITDMSKPKSLSQGIGCSAPRSVQSLPDGTLIWRAVDGWYAWNQALSGTIQGDPNQPSSSAPLLISATHRTLVEEELNVSRIRYSMSAYDSKRNMYLCAVASAGSVYNDIILGYNPERGWCRFDYGVDIGDILTCDDIYKDIIIGARWTETMIVEDNPLVTTYNNLLVLYKENHWTPPARASRYRTKWFRTDGVGRYRFNALNMFITFVESWTGELSMYVRQNMEPATISTKPVRFNEVPVATGNSPYDVARTMVGTTKLRNPRIGTRMAGVQAMDVRSIQFEFEATYPEQMHLLSMSIQTSTATEDNNDLINRNPKASDA